MSNYSDNYGHQVSGCSCGLTALAGLLAIFQAGAAVRALQIPTPLAQYINLPPALEFIASGLWAAAFTAGLILLIQRKPGAFRLVAALVTGFATYSIFRLLLFARADYDRQRLPFLFIVTVLILIIPAAYLPRPNTKNQSLEITDGDQPQAERKD